PSDLADELLGFDLSPGLPAALEALDFRQAVLPAGSRVTVVTWAEAMDGAESFVAAQREAGLEATHVVLQASDMPDWDDASRFEAQVFPRRSVAEIAALIQQMPAWTSRPRCPCPRRRMTRPRRPTAATGSASAASATAWAASRRSRPAAPRARPR